MAARGVHFALKQKDTKRLLKAAGDDYEVIEIVEDIEERWEDGFVGETDKAWDAIHRALGDGTLNPAGCELPLGRAILGGDLLTTGDDYFVYFTPADEVAAVSAALDAVAEEQLRAAYERINPADYGMEPDEEDWAYTLGNFAAVRELWRAAARAGRAVIFTVDG